MAECRRRSLDREISALLRTTYPSPRTTTDALTKKDRPILTLPVGDQTVSRLHVSDTAFDCGSLSPRLTRHDRLRRRRRSEIRERLQQRNGAQRAISRSVVTLCLNRFKELGIRLSVDGIRELIYVLQRVLHTANNGAALPLNGFSSASVGRKILNGLLQIGQISCPQPESWKPRNYDFHNAQPRRFLPSSELLIVNANREIVNSVSSYLCGESGQRTIRRSSKVLLDVNSRVYLGPTTICALEKGTRLRFNLDTAVSLLPLDEARRVQLLQAGFAAVGWCGDQSELHTSWKQHECGRLYASQPAVVNLPRKLRPALEPIDGGILCEIDYANFEYRIAYAESGLRAPEGDVAGQLAAQTGCARADVKDVLNGWLHGQTRGNLFGSGQVEKLRTRVELETLFASETPTLYATINALAHDGYRLQRRGAKVFFAALDAALAHESIPAGIPLHDGWIFSAKNESQGSRVKTIFEALGAELLEQPMPVKATFYKKV